MAPISQVMKRAENCDRLFAHSSDFNTGFSIFETFAKYLSLQVLRKLYVLNFNTHDLRLYPMLGLFKRRRFEMNQHDKRRSFNVSGSTVSKM